MLPTGPRRQTAALIILTLLAVVGCTPFRETVPARCVRPNFFDCPRSCKEPINFLRLRQDPPPVYLLGPNDILGIYIEGVLGKPDDPPPTNFPQQANLPPSIGFPIPIREDGSLSLPLIPPISVTGLTLAQAEFEIRKAYTIDRRILQPERQRIIVTLMRPRTYSVLVVREDSMMTGYAQTQRTGVGFEPLRQGLTKVVELRAYENDVLHALSETGGLPGVEAKNEVTVLRGAMHSPQGQDLLKRAMDDPKNRSNLFTASGVAVKIPLRIASNERPLSISPDDIILNNGDIVFVESRESEVFYTGGLLRGAQMPIPRDYDLDVLGAIAMSGGSISAAAGSASNVGGFSSARSGVGTLFPPTRVIVLRMVNGKQVAIELSLKKALLDAQERVLVQPNDIVLLEYTEFELFMNILMNNLNLNLSLNQLFSRGSSGD
jgi:protein involved in polysaccharide export with SLBB domain